MNTWLCDYLLGMSSVEGVDVVFQAPSMMRLQFLAVMVSGHAEFSFTQRLVHHALNRYRKAAFLQVQFTSGLALFTTSTFSGLA